MWRAVVVAGVSARNDRTNWIAKTARHRRTDRLDMRPEKFAIGAANIRDLCRRDIGEAGRPIEIVSQGKRVGCGIQHLVSV